MHIDPTTLAMQLVNFLVLIVLLHRFLFKPVLGAIDRRDAELNARHQRAETLLSDATADREAVAAERAALIQEAQTLRTAARDAADEERRRILDGARQSADALRQAAEERIQTERSHAEAALGRLAGDLAIDIAARLLADARPDLADRLWIDALRRELAALSAAEQADRLAGEAPLVLTTARTLPPDLRDGLIAALPAGRAITWHIDPELIAGVELTAPHHLIHHSWRAALAAAREGLRG